MEKYSEKPVIMDQRVGLLFRLGKCHGLVWSEQNNCWPRGKIPEPYHINVAAETADANLWMIEGSWRGIQPIVCRRTFILWEYDFWPCSLVPLVCPLFNWANFGNQHRLMWLLSQRRFLQYFLPVYDLAIQKVY
jgi:hypothetical protein